MKRIVSIFNLLFWGGFISVSLGQDSLTLCNTFDSLGVYLEIDSSSTWEIGKPSKLVFNDSYSDTGSIVTGLSSGYLANDTSVFYVVFTDSTKIFIPNYLGLYAPIQLSFTHRFVTDSITDFGNVEMSFDGGIKWHNVLTGENNAYSNPNYHYFESSGDTVFDSINVTGNSGGWVHSVFSKDITQLIFNDHLFDPDSIIFKFSFISDSINMATEGWQIDDICLSMDYITSINEVKQAPIVKVFPVPTNDIINITISQIGNQQDFMFNLYDMLGKKVLTKKLHPYENTVNVSQLTSGIYTYKMGATWGKIVVE